MSLIAGLAPVGIGLKVVSNLLSRGQGAPGKAFSEVLSTTMADRVIARWDRDGDGRISVGEFGGDAASFGKFDGDGNGYLSVGELEVGMARAHVGGHARAMADSSLRLLDADGDGVLSKLEYGSTKDNFGELDTNGDGRLSKAELVRGYRGQLGRQLGDTGI